MKRANRWLLIGVSLVLVALCVSCLGSLCILGKAWTPIIAPTPTPGLAGRSFNELFKGEEETMGLQRDQFLHDVVGQRVHGQVAVEFVDTDGMLWGHVGAFHFVTIEGLPSDALMSVTPNQVITIEGTIKGWDFSGFRVFVNQAVIQ